MKKLLAMLLVLAMTSCLFVACANNDSETDAPTAAPTEDTNTDESTDGNTDATEPDDNNGDDHRLRRHHRPVLQPDHL